ncbi:MAG: (d)CMP kinase [Haloarculaceae archaeon]
MGTNLLITVSGPPGSGTTTVSTALAEALDVQCISGGEIFRDIAEERGMTLTQLGAEADESPEIDRLIDGRIQRIAEKWGASNKGLVVNSRLAGWVAGNRADLRIWLDAPPEIRVERLRDREETESELRIQEVTEAGRFQSYYDVDITDRSFYDLHVNTARWSPDAVLQMILAGVEGYDPEADEGAYETDFDVDFDVDGFDTHLDD